MEVAASAKESAESFENEAKEFLEKAQRLDDVVERSGRHSIREELQTQLDKARDVKNKVNQLNTDMEKSRSVRAGCISK
ncbi:hypothetical protein RND71_016347 [Anisodus tanguticus]|uniref:Uncharacterized protein n=1 Tax=Anisodus tanguticus TaxID=243964 RepID=A0AAE1VL91_9SOLA|nr:hypothetical protein RND71_016347 [Anisodus tanguticus]